MEGTAYLSIDCDNYDCYYELAFGEKTVHTNPCKYYDMWVNRYLDEVAV